MKTTRMKFCTHLQPWPGMAKKRRLSEAAILGLLDGSESDEEHEGKHSKAATTQRSLEETQQCGDVAGKMPVIANNENKRSGDGEDSLNKKTKGESGLDENRTKTNTPRQSQENAVNPVCPNPFNNQAERSVANLRSIITRKKPSACCDDEPNPHSLAR